MSKDEKDPGHSGRPVAVAPKAAHQMLEDNPQAYLIDIRSTMEHLMVGHPVGAIHVPWIDEPEFTPDPHFVRKIREVMLGGLLGEGEENPPLAIRPTAMAAVLDNSIT